MVLLREFAARIIKPRDSKRGSPESLELFGVDVWDNLEGMQQYYSDPDFNRAFDGLYTSEPTALFLQHSDGEWIEW